MRARIRTIKIELFQHGELYDAEIAEGLPLRLGFAGLWCMADREGRFEWKPRELKLYILPHDSVDFSRVLNALASHGFLVRYEFAGRTYGWIPGFTRHQVVNNREEASRLPAPPEEAVTAYTNGTSTRGPRVSDASPTRAPRRTRGTGTGTGTGREESPLHRDATRRASGDGQPSPAETPRATWLTPYWDAWVSAYGGEPTGGQFAKALRPLHDKHGPEKTLAHWQNYLASTEALYASPAKFAATFGTWATPQGNNKRDPREPLLGESVDDYIARVGSGGRP